MTMWQNDFGKEFYSEVEAYENTCEHMTIDDYSEFMKHNVSYTTLLEWAFKQPNFAERFDADIYRAEKDYFHTHCHTVEEDE